jgi:hypothetical protein
MVIDASAAASLDDPGRTLRASWGSPGRRPRRPLIALVLVLCAAVILIFGLLWGRSRLRREAERYARDATEATSREWSAGALRVRASADLLARTPPEAMASYVGFLESQLGRLVTIRSVHVSGWSLRFRPLPVAAVTVNVTADFEKGAAVLSWGLVSEDGSWRVVMLRADSDQIKLPQSRPAPP